MTREKLARLPEPDVYRVSPLCFALAGVGPTSTFYFRSAAPPELT